MASKLICIVLVVIAMSTTSAPRVEADPILPDGWFVHAVKQTAEPVSVEGSVVERWSVRADSDLRLIDVAVGKDCVAVLTEKYSWPGGKRPAPDELTQASPRRNVQLECRDAFTGRVRWTLEFDQDKDGGPGNTCFFDGFLMVRLVSGTRTPGQSTPDWNRLQQSYWLIRVADGKVIRKFGPNDLARNNRAGRDGQDVMGIAFALKQTEEDRSVLASTLYHAGGPVAPAGNDVANWTYDQAQQLARVLGSRVRPWNSSQVVHWLLTGADALITVVPVPTRDAETRKSMPPMAAIVPRLQRYDITSEKTIWDTPLGAGHPICFCPPLILMQSGGRLFAYSYETGRPIWCYKFLDHSAGLVNLIATRDGVLLGTSALRNQPSLSLPPSDEERVPHVWLTKLDMHGKEVWQQELPILAFPELRAMGVGKSLVLWHRNSVACYSSMISGETASTKPSVAQEAERKARIGELKRQYDKASSRERAAICSQLGNLGDPAMLDRLLQDLRAASEREREDYLVGLGYLRDARAIPELIAYANLADLRLSDAALTSMEYLTQGDLERDPETQEWRSKRIQALHQEYDRQPPGALGVYSEREQVCNQLGRLKDRSWTSRVVSDLQNAQELPVAGNCIKCLYWLRDPAAIEPLLKYAESHPHMAKHVISPLQYITEYKLFDVSEWRDWWDVHKQFYTE